MGRGLSGKKKRKYPSTPRKSRKKAYVKRRALAKLKQQAKNSSNQKDAHVTSSIETTTAVPVGNISPSEAQDPLDISGLKELEIEGSTITRSQPEVLFAESLSNEEQRT